MRFMYIEPANFRKIPDILLISKMSPYLMGHSAHFFARGNTHGKSEAENLVSDSLQNLFTQNASPFSIKIN